MQLVRFVIGESSTPLNPPLLLVHLSISPPLSLLFPFPSSFPRPSKAYGSVYRTIIFDENKKYWYWVSKENNHR